MQRSKLAWMAKVHGATTALEDTEYLFFCDGPVLFFDDDGFTDLVASSATSVGYCNTMGTATTMNSLAEALGMQLPGAAAIPAPYRERGQMAYRTGQRIVEMVNADRILDEYQSLRVGDEVPLHPTAQPLEVLEVSPPSHLCLGQRISRGKSLVAKWTWDFRVELHQDQGVHESKRSLLEVETRIWLPNFCLRWGLGLPIRLGHSLMEAKMLRGIRSRVEKNQST